MSTKDDRWADWLRRGRYSGFNEKQVKRFNRRLLRVRNRTLRGARLRRGQHVLDVGGGTGLLTVEAARRAGPDGLTVGCDISLDALRDCAAAAGNENLQVQTVVGQAMALPFGDGSFDRVLTRSVLIYINDKRSAIAEFRRVLKPRGRLSIFEPINSAGAGGTWDVIEGPAELEEERKAVISHIRANWEHDAAMMGFDERDLVHYFVEAGFSDVTVSYEFTTTVRLQKSEEVATSFTMRGNPTAMTYEEAARAVLGSDAPRHLEQLAEQMSASPRRQSEAVTYLTARA
jgi:arsenite methyltransferase